MRTLTVLFCLAATVVAGETAKANVGSALRAEHVAACLPIEHSTASVTREWWASVFSVSSNDSLKQKHNLPSGIVPVSQVTDTTLCASLRSRIDSIAASSDSSYTVQDLDRPILVLGVGQRFLVSDPLHPNVKRRPFNYVFSATGEYLTVFMAMP